MTIRPKTRSVWLWAILMVIAALLIKFTVFDALRLAWFAHRIAGTDRIVATNWLSSVSVTILGDDTKKVVRAISAAGSGRPRFGTDWANIYEVNAKFYRGATLLGEIEMDGGGLFLVHYHRPPFRERTGVLHELVYKPVWEAARETELKNASLTAVQAKALATRLANDEASTLYHCEPFRDDQPARFEAGHWIWTAREGVGHSDMEATVELAVDGSTNRVDLKLLDSQNRLLFPTLRSP